MKVQTRSRKLGVGLFAVSLLGLIDTNAALTILSTEYKPDQVYPQFNCYWSSSCGTPSPGVTVRAFLKNTGASTVTIDDVNLAGYSLKTIIKRSTSTTINPQGQNSIYFYWDNPPQDVFDAGEPVWYKAEPSSVAPGRVAQVSVRLRTTPVTLPVTLGIVTSAGTLNTNIVASDANTPRLARIGYSEDLTKIYLHWRRNGGAAPTTVLLDGTNVNALTTTVGDPNVNFGVSVVTLPAPLPFFSHHVYQGVYADGKIAGAWQRAWTNKFIYATYCKFESQDCATWLTEAVHHGVNNIQMNLCGMCFDGSVWAAGYGYTIMEKDKLQPSHDPDMWFLDDEPDLGENNQVNTHCGTGLRIPCEGEHRSGTLVMKRMDDAIDLRNSRPNVPTTVNLDGGLEPQSFYTWGPAVDILQFDNYYEPRLKGAYTTNPERIPIHRKPVVSYAVARTGATASEPNPTHHLLYCNAQTNPDWPYPTPQSKRIEAYYSIAGGSKGLGYWWLKDGDALGNQSSAAARALWKEIGLLGNEFKTARDLIVRSTPVDMTLTPNSGFIWARALAVDANTIMLIIANDNFVNDINGCHVTNVPNAIVTATLPNWMLSSPTAFEITTGGRPGDVSTVLNGNQFDVNMGTLTLTRMIVLTTDPTLRTQIQQRYDSVVRSHVCAIAPELCTNGPPSITQQPVNRGVAPGGTTNFTIVASGPGTLSYQWQKNNSNLSNGGHYAGVTTSVLTISNADNNDVANYRCIVTNAYGSVTSSSVSLSLVNPPGTPTATSATSITDTTFTANWNSASNAIGYRLDISTNNSFSTFVTGYNNLDVGNVLSKNVTGLIGATTYYYRVRAYNAVTTSGNSGTITVATTATLVAPAPPIASAASGQTDTSFTANWNGSGGATGYRLDVSTTNTFSSFVAGYNNLDVGDVLNQNVTGLTLGATYYYRVRAYNGAGTSGNSSTIAVTLATADPCVTVLNLNFEEGFGLAGGGNIASNWTEWETDAGVVTGYDEAAIVRGGAHAQRVRVWGGASGSSGGVYQRIPVVAGQQFTVGAWTYSEDNLTTCYLGVDPAGGINGNAAGIIWSSGTTNVAWTQKTINGTATANYITLFLKSATTDNVKRNAYFDDAIAPVCADAPPTINLQPDDQSVILSSNAVFTILASGAPTLSYQWLKNGDPLTDGGHYSGSITPTLTITGVDSSDVADYRCVVTNAFGSADSDVAVLEVIVPSPCLPIANADFENGFSLAGGGNIANNWTEWEAEPGVVIGYDDTTFVHFGLHSQRIRISGGTNGSAGGIYQRVPVTQSQPYTISVWAYAGDSLTTCSLGVDPTGGTNASSGVTWSEGTTDVAWVQQMWAGTAASSNLTVFYKVTTTDNGKRNGYFDGSPVESLALGVQREGENLTLTWPECPSAHLEWTDNLTEPVNWTAVTNQVNVNSGQKNVTVSPAESAGFFRLVLE